MESLHLQNCVFSLSEYRQASEHVCGRNAAAGAAAGRQPESPPHGVEERPVVFQPQQLVGRGHVVRNGLFPVEEERVGGPDVAGQQVIQGQHLHRAFEAKPFVFPALTEEYVNGVFLQREASVASKWDFMWT